MTEREQCWHGWVPTVVHIKGSPLICESTYALHGLRRQPLALAAHQIVKYIDRYLHNRETCEEDLMIWFESASSDHPKPLPGHWPAGLVFDLMGNHEKQGLEKSRYPWHITMCCEPNELAPATAFALKNIPSTSRDLFINSLKEATYLRHGSSNQVLSLSRQNTEILYSSWTGNNTDFDAYWKVARTLLSGVCRRAPIRLYRPDAIEISANANEALQSMDHSLAIQSPYIQSTFILTEDNKNTTLGQHLNQLLPEYFPSPRAAVNWRTTLHGVPIPLAAPLIDLVDYTYPDGFAHICIIRRVH